MRGFIGFTLSLILLAILAGIGVGIYNAGVSAGLAQAGAVAAGAAAPYVYGWGFQPFFGFGFLGLLFPLLFLFLIFAALRAAVGARRGWAGGSGTGSWHDWRTDRERSVAELHRRLHEAEGTSPGAATDAAR